MIIKNKNMEVHLIPYGAAIQKLIYKGVDVVLGYDTIEEYENNDGNLGANCGRVANRIKNGTFELEGKKYHLAINNGPNSLHGGIKGFDKVFFEEKKISDTKVEYTYLSKDLEEGYPGNLKVKVTYELSEDSLRLSYEAVSDQTTIVNLTNHSYFNLSGRIEDITTHSMQCNCDKVYKVDSDGLIQKESFEVENTPFDFRKESKFIFSDDENQKLGTGYDHFFILKDHQVILYHPSTDLEMTVSTSYPGAQIYTANFLTKRKGKEGKEYSERKAVCIECSYLPDSIHIEDHPAIILQAGKEYSNYIQYSFKKRTSH